RNALCCGWLIGSLLLISSLMGCGVYSFTGASIEGKTILIQPLLNKAPNVNPNLSASLTSKIRTRILSQTGLAPIQSDEADYLIEGEIMNYQVTVTGIGQNQQASQNRLTVGVNVRFKNRLDEK